MSNSKKENSRKTQYKLYAIQNRAQANKQRKLERHKKAHPMDSEVPAQASGHTRKKPKHKGNFDKPMDFCLDGAGRHLTMPYRLDKDHYALVKESERPLLAKNAAYAAKMKQQSAEQEAA